MQAVNKNEELSRSYRVMRVICIIMAAISISGILRGFNNIYFPDTRFLLFSTGMKISHSIASLSVHFRLAEKILSEFASQITVETIKQIGIVMVLSNIILLTGSLLMLKLKKRGFHFYLCAASLQILAPLFILPDNIGILSSTTLALFFGAIGILLFRKLYEMN